MVTPMIERSKCSVHALAQFDHVNVRAYVKHGQSQRFATFVSCGDDIRVRHESTHICSNGGRIMTFR